MTTPAFNSLEEQASYGIGLQIGQQLQEAGFSSLSLEALTAGIRDTLEDRPPAVPVGVIHQALREMQQRAQQALAEKQEKLAQQGEQFLQENSQREGVTVTESGLQFEVLHQGEGAIPSKQDKVRVHYTGKLLDGTVFDSSVERGQPAEFPVNGVIAGWTEALTMMPTGSRWLLTIPYSLAYGERGAGAAIPPYSTLIFEVELLEIL
ncbi:MAG: FKBP-type peptidyl-prolyl cis-trans isomerase [Enterobacteriaceae bacterium]